MKYIKKISELWSPKWYLEDDKLDNSTNDKMSKEYSDDDTFHEVEKKIKEGEFSFIPSPKGYGSYAKSCKLSNGDIVVICGENGIVKPMFRLNGKRLDVDPKKCSLLFKYLSGDSNL